MQEEHLELQMSICFQLAWLMSQIRLPLIQQPASLSALL